MYIKLFSLFLSHSSYLIALSFISYNNVLHFPLDTIPKRIMGLLGNLSWWMCVCVSESFFCLIILKFPKFGGLYDCLINTLMFLIELELVKGTEKEMHPHFFKKKKETQNISASPVSSPSCGWTPTGLGLILVLLCSLRQLSIKLPALHQLWNKQERCCQMQNKTFDLEFDQVGN